MDTLVPLRGHPAGGGGLGDEFSRFLAPPFKATLPGQAPGACYCTSVGFGGLIQANMEAQMDNLMEITL